MREKPPHYPRFRHTCFVPSPYQPKTIAAVCSDFGLKSEDEAALVRRWYGDGRALVRRRSGAEDAGARCVCSCRFRYAGGRQTASVALVLENVAGNAHRLFRSR